MENNKIYCILCGSENKSTDKFCRKCGEKLDQKDDSLQTYAKEKIKDKVTGDIKDKATDSLLDMLKKFLNSKAYGVILSLSIVAASAGMLVGGDGIKEFSQEVPGMFKDGQIYAWSFNYDDALFHAGVSGYPGYDENGNIDKIYLAGEAHFSQYIDLKVTGSNGKTLINEKIEYDENASTNRYCYVIKDLGATITSDPEAVDGSNTYDDNYYIELGTAHGVKKFESHRSGRLERVEEYHDNGIIAYQYWDRGNDINPLTGNNEISYGESFTDENGRLITSVTMIGDYIETKSSYTYTGDVTTVVYTRENDRITTGYYEKDSQDRTLKQIHYDSEGNKMYTDAFEYYPSGQTKSHSMYGLVDDSEDTLSRYEEYYENGKTKLSQNYYNGRLGEESVYNEDGSGTFTSYGYSATADKHYVGEYAEFTVDENGNHIVSMDITTFSGSADVMYKTEYNRREGTAVKTGYNTTFDENGNTAHHYELTYGPVSSVTYLTSHPNGTVYAGRFNERFMPTLYINYYDNGNVEREQYYDAEGNVTKVTVYKPDGSINTLQSN